jgi:hypothetical protein
METRPTAVNANRKPYVHEENVASPSQPNPDWRDSLLHAIIYLMSGYLRLPRALGTFAVLLILVAVAYAAETLIATADANGRPHAASVKIDGPSYVRCTSATGQAGDGEPPSCQIQAPGFAGKVEIGKIVSLKEEGYVELKCNGNPPLRCSAQITP